MTTLYERFRQPDWPDANTIYLNINEPTLTTNAREWTWHPYERVEPAQQADPLVRAVSAISTSMTRFYAALVGDTRHLRGSDLPHPSDQPKENAMPEMTLDMPTPAPVLYSPPDIAIPAMSATGLTAMHFRENQNAVVRLTSQRAVLRQHLHAIEGVLAQAIRLANAVVNRNADDIRAYRGELYEAVIDTRRFTDNLGVVMGETRRSGNTVELTVAVYSEIDGVGSPLAAIANTTDAERASMIARCLLDGIANPTNTIRTHILYSVLGMLGAMDEVMRRGHDPAAAQRFWLAALVDLNRLPDLRDIARIKTVRARYQVGGRAVRVTADETKTDREYDSNETANNVCVLFRELIAASHAPDA